LPRLPLLGMRHARDGALEAVIGIAAAGGVSPARFQRAGAPQLERVAVTPLLQAFSAAKRLA
jgi:hypothetical protein